MNLKQKSLIISLGTTLALIVAIFMVVNGVTLVKFQEIENQRVERNIRRVSAVLEDRFFQLSSKLTDWTNWDDTYKFLNDKNEEYVASNLVEESFKNIGVDEALFIDKSGGLVASIISTGEKETGFSEDLYSRFSTGSALLKIDPSIGYNHGILKANGGLLLFVVRNVFKSDISGESRGTVVFARYLDTKMLNSVKELTQFEASIVLWDDPKMSSDFERAKNSYQSGNKTTTGLLDDKTISGYLVVEDIYGKPQAIVRTDIGRDISLQGRESMFFLIMILALIGAVISGANYWFLVGGALRKISIMAFDIDSLGKDGRHATRLVVGGTGDELDKLRQKINEMLDSLSQSKMELSEKSTFIEKVMDNLTIGIAVNEISTGKAIYMNETFEKIYGWTKDILVSVDAFFEKVYPDPVYREETKKRVLTDIKSGDPERMHWVNLEVTKSNGEKRFVEARNIPLVNQDLMVSTVIDVTETKISEDERKKYTEDLEKLNETMVNRELRMIQLKKQLEEKKHD